MTQESRADDATVREAIRRQVEAPEDHDLGLIEECLHLTPEQRLRRLTSWVALVASARPIQGPAPGGRH
jgi:hypothetical protein